MKLKKIIPIAVTTLITLNCMTFAYAENNDNNNMSTSVNTITPKASGVIQDGFLIGYNGVVEAYFGNEVSVSIPQYIEGPTGAQIPVIGVTSGLFSIEKSPPVANVVFPEGITTIGDFMFYNQTRLETVTIPRSVTRIYPDAFKGCTGLNTIYCYKGSAADNTSLYNRYVDEITFVYLD